MGGCGIGEDGLSLGLVDNRVAGQRKQDRLAKWPASATSKPLSNLIIRYIHPPQRRNPRGC